MHPFMWGEERKNEKQKKLWGEGLYKKVLDMNVADQKASVSSI